MIKKFFSGSIIFTVIAIVAWFFIGAGTWLNVAGWLQAVFIVVILWILETSLSFDNAVVNATVLKKMSPVRQHRFLTRGMVIAVFGMRVLFPLIIVAIVGWINPLQALNLAIFNPDAYAAILNSSHIVIAGFGGAFLMMVALNFFLNLEKKNHWIGPVERTFQKVGQLKSVEMIIGLLVVFLIAELLPTGEMMSFVVSAIRWIIIYAVIDSIAVLLEKKQAVMQSAAKVWLSLFMYLEILDASFSFDGVIGAFALSKNIFIIALWLWIGAMFVRSITIMLVRKWTLAKYMYLEHWAFWAILALATIMFISTMHEVPEVVTGLIGAWFIGVALYSSIRANKRSAMIEKQLKKLNKKI